MFLGQNDMMAYLTMMAQRLVELHRVLKNTGSLYLHCDSTASHYLKLLLDAVFAPVNFRNEIIWKRTSSHNDAKSFGQVTDTILCYSKSSERIWNHIYIDHDESYKSNFYRFEDDHGSYRLHEIIRTASMGPRPNLVYEYKGYTPQWGWRMERPKLEALDAESSIIWSKTGRPYRKTYLTDGRAPTNLWSDIGNVSAQAKERLGYPTQKPETLLERIITASSNEGDLVLDPFCGCGTAIAVAERLHRRWIGIDITHLAITLMRHRLNNSFGKELSPYEIIGQPKDLESSRALALESENSGRYQFETWATGLVDAFPLHSNKKGSDKGIDGHINFFDDNSGKAKTIIVQVKSGHVNSSHIRDLKGVLDREKAQIGVYITLEEPTKPMIEEATTAGFYEPEHFPGTYYPRIQILTIQQLLDGKNVDYPRYAPVATFKRAPRAQKANDNEQNQLF
jgi:site-specific DNA-methyltransferase (adenine-specific)